MYDHQFLSEHECIDYLDDLYNEGIKYEMLLEDHLKPVSDLYQEGEDAIDRSDWVPSWVISDSFCKTWNEIEMLPTTEGRA